MAPGWPVTCAANNGEYQTNSGTSYGKSLISSNLQALLTKTLIAAAPAVAGLAAYFLGLSQVGMYPKLRQKGSVAKNMRDLIVRNIQEGYLPIRLIHQLIHCIFKHMRLFLKG